MILLLGEEKGEETGNHMHLLGIFPSLLVPNHLFLETAHGYPRLD